MMIHRGFLDLERVLIPRSLADFANDYLRKVGREGHEGFALWAGQREGSVFHITETVIPAQQGLRHRGGMCVTVAGEELFRLNVHLFERGLTLLAQLHSHPDEAYHSDTDDAYPIATMVGAFSLVVPDFAVHPFALERCAIYRLLPGRGWIGLGLAEVRRLLHLIDN